MFFRGSRLTLFTQILLILTVCATVAAQEANPFRIRINIAARRLDLLYQGQVVREYPVAVGTPGTPSPVGTFQIINKVIDPTWYPEGRIPVIPGPDNPVGSRWLGLSAPGLGIHGTNNPASIRKAVSGGCFRMHNADVEELHDLVPKGTFVEVVYEPIEVTREPNDLSPIIVRYHPDIYHRGKNTTAHLETLLRWAGYSGQFSEGLLENLLRTADGRPQVFPPVYSAELNGITFDFALPVELGELQVEGMALARLLGLERAGLTALAHLFEHGWSVTPGMAAKLFQLTVTLDINQARVKFSAPYIRMDTGNLGIAVVAAGHVQLPDEEPFTIVFSPDELPYPRVPITINNVKDLQAGYKIGGLIWVDLEELALAGLDFAYEWSQAEGRLRINGKEVGSSVVEYAGRPMVPLGMVREMLEPGQLTATPAPVT